MGIIRLVKNNINNYLMSINVTILLTKSHGIVNTTIQLLTKSNTIVNATIQLLMKSNTIVVKATIQLLMKSNIIVNNNMVQLLMKSNIIVNNNTVQLLMKSDTIVSSNTGRMTKLINANAMITITKSIINHPGFVMSKINTIFRKINTNLAI